MAKTLQDLCDSTNYALRQMGWPERSLAEVRCFVGNGVRKLIERAVPECINNRDFEQCFSIFQTYYLEHCQDTTCLYEGVAEMLCDVHSQGYKTAIVSNKLQAGVDELYHTYFRDVVDVAIGEREGVRRKPAPDMVRLALRELGVNKDEAVYVGDSEVDVETARISGLPCISVLWGFRTREELLQVGADCFVERPQDIRLILNKEI